MDCVGQKQEEAQRVRETETETTQRKFAPFQRVLCRYGGGRDAFPGSIAGVNDDGTYTVGYDDGDIEQNVAGSLISVEGSGKDVDESNIAGTGVKQGTPVMCRYGGGEVKFAGLISAVHSNGTYDIAYEDGDAEYGVSPEMFDVLYPLSVGDVVTCRYGGGEDAFPGQISAAHADGTYDIAYDDGDSEANIARSLIIAQG